MTLACQHCQSTNTVLKGPALSQGKIKHRYKCKDCTKNSYSDILQVKEIKEGWNKAGLANDEAKMGNIPEIGLEENLQGLEVTGVTYLKKDANNVLHWVKTKAKHSSVDMLEEFVARLIDRVPAANVIPEPAVTDDELLTQITITDLHCGMYSWAEESGANYDLGLCYDLTTRSVDLAIQRSPSSKIGMLVELGDFFHYDGHNAITPRSGTLVDADGRYQKMIEVGEDIIIETIEKMLVKYSQVKVIIAQGNHDISTSDTLRSLIKRYYRKNERLEVIGGPNPYYAYKHGMTMIGCHHGHLKKKPSIPAHFAQFFAEMWGSTTYRYLHTGHLHCHHEEEKSGALTIQHSTLAASEAYAAHMYDNSLRSINTITYSNKYGMLSRNIIPFELVCDNL